MYVIYCADSMPIKAHLLLEKGKIFTFLLFLSITS